MTRQNMMCVEYVNPENNLNKTDDKFYSVTQKSQKAHDKKNNVK